MEQKLTEKTFSCKKSIHMINDMEVGYERKHYQNPVQIRTMLGVVVFNLQRKQKYSNTANTLLDCIAIKSI